MGVSVDQGLSLGRPASLEDPLKIAILVSGRGSNMQAIAERSLRGELPVRVVRVIADRFTAQAVARAEALGIDTRVLDYRALGPSEYHNLLAEEIERSGAEWIVLAGYMRILPEPFVRRFEWRIVNIHPSLLPAFPGLHPHRQAIEHGVKLSGCTVHLVDTGVDTGPIILQRAVPVLDDDTPESLAERILAVEHQAYPEALTLLASGRLRLVGRRVVSVGDTSARLS